MADLTSKIKELIKTLSNANLSDDDKEKFIADLADFIRNEKGTNYLDHYPITEIDWEDNNSLFKKFNKLIDLDNAQGKTSPTEVESLSYIEHLLSLSGDNAKLWNESLRLMLDLYRNKIDNKNSNTITATKKVGSTSTQHEFVIQDILKANAGWSFVSEWVKPYENIDNFNYDTVRGEDKINQVLESHKNIQFTHTQLDENDNDSKNQVQGYIRLIMPKYTRRVEVEDLNRNFWVIGQVLTAVCAYLFDDESPIVKMFKHLMNETTQLWENVLYIWAALAALSEKDYVPHDLDHIRCEVIYLPNDSQNHEMKFDNFDISHTDGIEWSEIKKRLLYLIDMYPKKHLYIAPVIRYKNYAKNYYEGEKYPGILIYDRNTGEWEIIQFKGSTEDFGQIGNGFANILEIAKVIDSNQHGPNAARDTSATTIYVSDKYYNQDIEETSSYEYYCAVRTEPELGCKYMNGALIPTFKVKIEDAIYKAVNGESRSLGYLEYDSSNSGDTNLKWVDKSFTSTTIGGTEYSIKSGNSYYLGEVLSAHKSSKKPAPTATYIYTKRKIGENNATIVKVGNYLPEIVTLGNTTSNGQVYSRAANSYIALINPYSQGDQKTEIFMDWVPRLNSAPGSRIDIYGTASYNFYWNKQTSEPSNVTSRITLYNAYESAGSTITNDQIVERFRTYILPKIINANENNLQYFLLEYGNKNQSWFNWQGRMYWAQRTMAQLVRYVPVADTTKSADVRVTKSGKYIGYIDINKALNYIDKAYDGYDFGPTPTQAQAGATGTWRVPRFTDQTTGEATTYWSCTKTMSTGESTVEYFTNAAFTSLYGSIQSSIYTDSNVNTARQAQIDAKAAESASEIFDLNHFNGKIELLNGFTNEVKIYVVINKDGTRIAGTKDSNNNYVIGP